MSVFFHCGILWLRRESGCDILWVIDGGCGRGDGE